MPAVVNVFDHLRRLEIRPDQWCIELLVKRRQRVTAGSIQLTDNGLGWAPEVLYSRPLAQKFRIVANAELNSGLLPRELLQGGNHDLEHRARQDGAANDDGVARCLALECLADLFTNSPNIAEVEIPIGLTRCANANE